MTRKSSVPRLRRNRKVALSGSHPILLVSPEPLADPGKDIEGILAKDARADVEGVLLAQFAPFDALGQDFRKDPPRHRGGPVDALGVVEVEPPLSPAFRWGGAEGLKREFQAVDCHGPDDSTRSDRRLDLVPPTFYS